MNILTISLHSPYPPTIGDSVIAYNWIRILSKDNTVSCMCFDEKSYSSRATTSKDNHNMLYKYCKDIEVIQNKRSNIFTRIIKYIFTKTPYSFTRYDYKLFSKTLVKNTKHNNYDVIIVIEPNLLVLGSYINDISAIKIAVPIDSLPLALASYIASAQSPVDKIFYRSQINRWEFAYRSLLNSFDASVFVNECDTRDVKKRIINGSEKLYTIPNGVDIQYFNKKHDSKDVEVHTPYLLFTGSMNSTQSKDAIEYFLPIYKKLKNIVPSLHFYIVGQNPLSEIITMTKHDKSIHVIGYVNDIRPYLLGCSVYVCPMITGAGIKNRLLEAMAMGCAIVSTSTAIRGIENPGTVIIADRMEDFINSIIDLLNDNNKRQSLGDNARKHIVENYSWENQVLQLKRIISKLS